MKVSITLPEKVEKLVTLHDMPTGSIGISRNKRTYLRTLTTAVCLEDFAYSYTDPNITTTVLVDLLPVGTIVSFVVE